LKSVISRAALKNSSHFAKSGFLKREIDLMYFANCPQSQQSSTGYMTALRAHPIRPDDSSTFQDRPLTRHDSCITDCTRLSSPQFTQTMPTTVIEIHLTAIDAVLAECSELKSRVETERIAVSAITAALVDASETLVQRGWVSPQKVQGLTLSMEENALDLSAALDEVDASILTAIAPVEIFAQATERMRTARRKHPTHDGAAAEEPGKAESGMFDSVAARHSALCEHLLESVREFAGKAARRLDDLREKIDKLQSLFGEIMAAMSPTRPVLLH
jgi:hypothetical protein